MGIILRQHIVIKRSMKFADVAEQLVEYISISGGNEYVIESYQIWKQSQSPDRNLMYIVKGALAALGAQMYDQYNSATRTDELVLVFSREVFEHRVRIAMKIFAPFIDYEAGFRLEFYQEGFGIWEALQHGDTVAYLKYALTPLGEPFIDNATIQELAGA